MSREGVRFFGWKHDGGPTSGVKLFYLFQFKSLGTIGILRFKDGTREAFHDHAFNALTWFIKGKVEEEKLDGSKKSYGSSLIPKYTPRSNMHRVRSFGTSYALTFRGPWVNVWQEYRPIEKEIIMLTHGRKVIEI